MKRAKILIVENEFLIALGTQDALALAGFDCNWIASSIAAARDHLGRQAFDAVVLDAQLSDGPADGLADELAARNVPFVCHTGYRPETLGASLRSRRVVTKPADSSELVSALDAVLPVELRSTRQSV